MRLLQPVILILLAAALAVSGCSGPGPTVTATPGQIASPGITVSPTSAAIPSATPAPTPASAGQLFDISAVHAYSYRMTSVAADGQTTRANFALANEDTTYGGVPARHLSVSFDAPATASTGAGEVSVDVYTSKQDNTTLGGHMRMVANGQAFIDADIPAGEATTYTSNDVLGSGGASGNAQLTDLGPDTVTIDGKTYACTKYAYIEDGITRTVWYTAWAPMPVRMQWTDKGTAYTVELLSWS